MSAMDERAIEQEVQAKGLTAPRVTPDDLDSKIMRVLYHVFPGTTAFVVELPAGALPARRVKRYVRAIAAVLR